MDIVFSSFSSSLKVSDTNNNGGIQTIIASFLLGFATNSFSLWHRKHKIVYVCSEQDIIITS